MTAINWSRGFKRLWFLFAIAWVVTVPISVAYLLAREHAKEAVFWDENVAKTMGDSIYRPDVREKLALAYQANARQERSEAHVIPQLKFLFSRDQLISAIMVMLGPPLLVYAGVWLITVSTTWVVSGFRNSKPATRSAAPSDHDPAASK